MIKFGVLTFFLATLPAFARVEDDLAEYNASQRSALAPFPGYFTPLAEPDSVWDGKTRLRWDGKRFSMVQDESGKLSLATLVFMNCLFSVGVATWMILNGYGEIVLKIGLALVWMTTAIHMVFTLTKK